MLLPVGAAFGPLTRPVELWPVELRPIPRGAVLARTREARAFVAATVVAGLVKIPGAVAGGTLATILALLPRF
jgi:hypothetical protein